MTEGLAAENDVPYDGAYECACGDLEKGGDNAGSSSSLSSFSIDCAFDGPHSFVTE